MFSASRTIRGSVGGGHHHHSGLEQRREQLLQDHGVSDIGHLTGQNRTTEEERHIHALYNLPFLATPHVCASEVKPCCQHSMLISVIQVCSFSPLCLVMAIHTPSTRMHAHIPKPLELTANGHEAAFC